MRPENIAFANPDEAALKGRIEIVEQLGAETLYYVTVAPDLPTVTVRANAGGPAARDQEIGLSFSFDHLHLFDDQGRRLRPAA